MSLADSLKGFVEPPQPSAPRNAGEAKAATRPTGTNKKKREMGKHRDPAFGKLTVYVRETTRKDVAIKLLQEGKGRELSELVEQLLSDWTAKRLNG
jgi:hypothetical protein